MRILSLASPPEGEEVCLSYISRDLKGNDLVNGKPARIVAVPAGEDKILSRETLYITLPSISKAHRDDVICLSGDDVILKVKEIDGKQLILSVERSGFIAVSAKVEIFRALTVGVLTVSDKGSRGERIDTSGPALVEEVSLLGAGEIIKKTVPDEKDAIISTLTEWADFLELNLVLVTGGTGLSPRDVTPESVISLAEKEIPGFSERMRMDTSKITERAILSRSIAVTRKNTLIIALPGSRKGAVECFQAVASVVRHAVEIICGWGGECGS